MLDGTLCTRAETGIPDETEAVAAVVDQITGRIQAPDLVGVIFFCAAEYDPVAVARAFTERLDCPVMLQIGDEWYVRSIEKVNPDGSLTFFCAIDNGLPLTVARGIGLVDTLRRQVEEIERAFSDIAFTLGCDCILRRLEIMGSGQRAEVESLLRRIRFIGFSTFGEQFNAVHVNQTLTGVVFGTRAMGR